MDILLNLVFLAVGALVTWLVARHYYMKAASELKTESDKLLSETHKLQHLTKTALRALEKGGLADLSRNEEGSITGLTEPVYQTPDHVDMKEKPTTITRDHKKTDDDG